MKYISIVLSFLGSIIGLAGCTAPDSVSSADLGTQAAALPTVTSVAVATASFKECPLGGVTIKSFADTNKNGTLDPGETVLSSNSVCNGAQGLGAGIIAKPALAASCAAGGIVVTTFVDANNNGALDPAEMVTSANTICNGIHGTNGVDGSSAHLTITAATLAQCPTGGSVYKTWTDNISPMSTVVCNGLSGQNGQNGQDGQNAAYSGGHVGDLVSGKTYSACHHDYLYLGGWLIFRHQSNGSADQGVGTTGFNVWNVDITDFALASEVGGVTYCSLHWDATQKRLGYSVVDNSDGLGGQTGTIVMQ